MEDARSERGCGGGYLDYYSKLATLVAGAVASWGSAVFLRPTSQRTYDAPFATVDFALACVQWALVAAVLLVAISVGTVIFKCFGAPSPRWRWAFWMLLALGLIGSCVLGYYCNLQLGVLFWPDSKLDQRDAVPLAFFGVQWIVVIVLLADVIPPFESDLSTQ